MLNELTQVSLLFWMLFTIKCFRIIFISTAFHSFWQWSQMAFIRYYLNITTASLVRIFFPFRKQIFQSHNFFHKHTLPKCCHDHYQTTPQHLTIYSLFENWLKMLPVSLVWNFPIADIENPHVEPGFRDSGQISPSLRKIGRSLHENSFLILPNCWTHLRPSITCGRKTGNSILFYHYRQTRTAGVIPLSLTKMTLLMNS